MIHGSYSKENARFEELFWEGRRDVRVARRKLKYSCSVCGKPILRGEKYVFKRRFVGFGWLIKYTHVSCLEGVMSDGQGGEQEDAVGGQ